MNRKERLMATLQGRVVDRPPVCFYELNGLDESQTNPDPFNIYNHPSWKPLLDLTREKTDRIVMRKIPFIDKPHDELDELTQTRKYYDERGSLHTITEIRVGDRVLTAHMRRDRDTNTVWTVEHLLKDVDDLQAYLKIATSPTPGKPDVSGVLDAEAQLGDTGIVMIDMPDSLCLAAYLFDMATYTVIAMTEQELITALLEKLAEQQYLKTQAVAQLLPGRLWRIYGPEYASPPYLPPKLFKEYVVKYDSKMIEMIHRHHGYARIHSHGNLKAILDDIVKTGCMGLDPIEPPPQGDVELDYVREKYGRKLVLFGNLEISDIENMPTPEFEKKIITALKQGTYGQGRGFVLMPSACPFGRILSDLTLKNYQKIVELCESFE